MTVDTGGGDEDLHADINVTPLVDVMLVLLVIFMVVTPLLRLKVPIELPLAKTSEDAKTERAQVTLSAAADGTVQLNGSPVARDGLEAALKGLYATRTDRTIFLEADRNLQYAVVVDLMDACRAAGVERIGVLTRKPSGA